MKLSGKQVKKASPLIMKTSWHAKLQSKQFMKVFGSRFMNLHQLMSTAQNAINYNFGSQNKAINTIRKEKSMPQQTPVEKNNEFIFLSHKTGKIYDQCIHACCSKKNDYSSLTNKQVTCIKSCTSKLYNAYSFIYHLAEDQGVARASEKQIKAMSFS